MTPFNQKVPKKPVSFFPRKEKRMPASACLELLQIEPATIVRQKQRKLVSETLMHLAEGNTHEKQKLQQFLAHLPAEQRRNIENKLVRKREIEHEVAEEYLWKCTINPNHLPPAYRWRKLVQSINEGLYSGNMEEMKKAAALHAEITKALEGKKYDAYLKLI